MKFFFDHDITPQLNNSDALLCSISFSEREQKWYCWAFRAKKGFEIGSVVKQNELVYRGNGEDWVAYNLEDAKNMAKAFAEDVKFFK